ncbi:MAG: response regulator [Roseibium sp.]
MSTMRNVCIVDDEPSTCRALQRLLRVAGYNAQAYTSAEDFLASDQTTQAECLLLDVHMPNIDGFALQSMLNGRPGIPPIVFLTGAGDVPMSVRAMQAGAANFLLKPVDETELIDAIEHAMASNPNSSRTDQKFLLERLQNLTVRERDVLTELLTGALNKQIADTLDIAERTVKMHRARIMRKLEAKNLLDLAPYKEFSDKLL